MTHHRDIRPYAGRMPHRRPSALTLLAATIIAVSLSACTPVALTAVAPSPSASESTQPEPSPSESPTPTPTPSASAVPANVPTDCRKVVDAASYDGFFQGTPLNDPGFVDPTLVGPIAPVPPPAGASAGEAVDSAVELRCIWRDPNADITGMSIEYSRVDPAIATQYVTDLAAQGYTCTDANGGRQCQLVQPNEQYPVDEANTVLARGGVVIDVQQANFPTVNLMAALAAVVWAD